MSTMSTTQPNTVGLSQAITQNPGAVFVKRTDAVSVDDKEGFRRVGHDLVNDVFVTSEDSHSPGRFIMKPNVTSPYPRDSQGEVLTYDGGIVTNAHFVGGMIDGLLETGHTDIVVAEGGGGDMERNFGDRGYLQMVKERGIKLFALTREQYADDELNWVEIDGVVAKDLPAVCPINDPGTALINIPTLKTHPLAITTLCTKNLQGSFAVPYRTFCSTMEGVKNAPEVMAHLQPDFEQRVTDRFERHRNDGYPWWDRWGIRAELYCQRACDALLAVRPYLNVIEGVVARDGTGFRQGTDSLTNLVLLGLHPINVDAVATYLMGHTPQNIGYLKIAQERGLGENDPERIEVYELIEGRPIRCHDLSKIGRLCLGVHPDGDPSQYLFF